MAYKKGDKFQLKYDDHIREYEVTNVYIYFDHIYIDYKFNRLVENDNENLNENNIELEGTIQDNDFDMLLAKKGVKNEINR